jgi:hypothetical protein
VPSYDADASRVEDGYTEQALNLAAANERICRYLRLVR